MKKELELVLTIGIPASGKSTWAKEFISKNDNWAIVSRDDIRYSWQNRGMLTPKMESLVTDSVNWQIEYLINNGCNVIYDATNLKAQYIKRITGIVKHTAKVSYRIFDIPLETAIERDLLRQYKVGKDVIEKMYKDYLILLDSFDFQTRNPTRKIYTNPYNGFDNNKQKAYIFDIDGTLAHVSGKRSWYDYEKVINDDLDIAVSSILHDLSNSGYCILIVSGREDSSLLNTQKWLLNHNIPYNQIFMRKTGDSRKDSIVKEEIFWENIEPYFNIMGVFDDRDQVVKMWRELGLKCFQVEYGNF